MKKSIFLALLIVNSLPLLANADLTCSAKCKFYSRGSECGGDYIQPSQGRKVVFDVTTNDVKTPTPFFECEAPLNVMAKSQEEAVNTMGAYCFDYGSELLDLWQGSEEIPAPAI